MLVAAFAAVPAGGTMGQTPATDGASTPTEAAVEEDVAAAVDFLVAEYGLDEATAIEQIHFSTAMEDRVPEIRQALGESYGGAWVDNSTPKVLFVASTLPDKASSALQDLGITATVRPVNYSQTELVDASNRLNRLLEEGYPNAPEKGSGFRMAVDIQANELDLQLSPAYPITPTLNDAIASVIPRIEVKPTGQWTNDLSADCPFRNDCEPNLRGGITVDAESFPNDPCTLGYTMKQNGVNYVSTASHCAGSPWSHHGRTIGPTRYTRDDGRVDGKIIDINNRAYWNATAYVFRPSDHSAPVQSQISDPESSLEGVLLCSEGRNGGHRCGELTDWNYNPGGGDAENFEMGKVNRDACSGDSGGPVLNPDNNRAFGMVVGGNPRNCSGSGYMYFMFIRFFETGTPGYNLAFPN